jgi:hypothetical protein
VLCQEFCKDDVSFYWEMPIFRNLPTENIMTDQSYVDAVVVFSLMQVISPAVTMTDIIFL